MGGLAGHGWWWVVLAGCGWFWVVVGGFGLFWVVACFISNEILCHKLFGK